MSHGEDGTGVNETRDIERLSTLYAATPRDEPPSHRDDAIRAAARAGTRAQAAAGVDGAFNASPPMGASTASGAANDRRWMKPLATAALVIVTGSTVLLMNLQGPPPLTPAEEAAPSADNGKAQRMDFLAQRTPDTSPARAADEPAAPRVNAGAPDTRQAQTPQSQTPQAPVPQLQTPQPQAPQPPSDEERSVRAVVTAKARSSDTQPAQTLMAAPAREMKADAAREAIVAAPAAGANAQAMAAPVPMLEQATGPAAVRARDSRIALAREAESPQGMLARILELRKSGRLKEADDLLLEFRKRYPTFELPEELRRPLP